MKPPLLYALQHGQLCATERMAIATATALSYEFDPIMLAPPGVALSEATRMGLRTVAFRDLRDFFGKTRPFFAQHRHLACMASAAMHSIAFAAWSRWYRRAAPHLHIVHGGVDERVSYRPKRYLAHLPMRYVAVSDFVRDRLVAHGVAADRVSVIENFLQPEYLDAAPNRARFETSGVRRVLIVSRANPISCVDLIFDALDRAPALRSRSFRILGTGWDLEALRARARGHHNVSVCGFGLDVAMELARADLVLQLCPCEPFGLAILEAMAAHVPVLVPDSGGAGALVADGETGFQFRANDVRSLTERLLALDACPADRLNRIVAAARRTLETRFSAFARIEDYRKLLELPSHLRKWGTPAIIHM
jgi:glycosyltransferase involved in cell wall biosynthesis